MKFRSDKHRLPPFTKSGMLLVNKPKDWTSHDVVSFVRSRFNVPKVGHCGTLDPAATGLLVVVLGKFTKLSQRFSGEDKTYEGRIFLGTVTDSQDMDGNVVETKDASSVTPEMLKEAFSKFIGEIDQVPPMVSAVKKDGERLYALARQGIEVDREPKHITIFSIDITNIELPYADFVVHCSKGTYIRTLCHDVGKLLGCGACLFSLNRVRSGDFELKDACTIDEMREWEQETLASKVDEFLHMKLQKLESFSAF